MSARQATAAAIYRRIDFEANVLGADPQALTLLLYDTLVDALGRILLAQDRRDNAARSAATTRALSTLATLEMGIDPAAGGVSDAILTFIRSARLVVLDSITRYDARAITMLRADVRDIRAALGAARD